MEEGEIREENKEAPHTVLGLTTLPHMGESAQPPLLGLNSADAELLVYFHTLVVLPSVSISWNEREEK